MLSFFFEMAIYEKSGQEVEGKVRCPELFLCNCCTKRVGDFCLIHSDLADIAHDGTIENDATGCQETIIASGNAARQAQNKKAGKSRLFQYIDTGYFLAVFLALDFLTGLPPLAAFFLGALFLALAFFALAPAAAA